ncbi:mitochondrial carrier protein-domain-containing protein [Helicostylum pulchrum]|nr:mitochondrial carrier protein-domain-containing protein [Helicostylum pulchrum]
MKLQNTFLSGGEKSSTGSPLTQFLAGGICGIMGWIVVFPLGLVKTLIQKETLQDIYARNGIACFYRGITVTLIRVFPIHSLNFLVYEQTLLLLRHLSHRD